MLRTILLNMMEWSFAFREVPSTSATSLPCHRWITGYPHDHEYIINAHSRTICTVSQNVASVGLQRICWIFMHICEFGIKTNTCGKVNIHLYTVPNVESFPSFTSWPCHFNRIAGNVPNNCTIFVGTFAKIGHKVWLLVRRRMMGSHWLFASFQQLSWWNGSRSHVPFIRILRRFQAANLWRGVRWELIRVPTLKLTCTACETLNMLYLKHDSLHNPWGSSF